jgi:pimeloyl-ACP methyl ester carboxylesterase
VSELVIIPPLIESEGLFAPFVRALEAHGIHGRVIDPPGVGEEGSPHGLPSTRSLARAIVDRWERADVFAISLGGMIAQWIAIERPERIDRLVIASSIATGLSASLRPLEMVRCMFGSKEHATKCLVDAVVSGDASDIDVHPRSHRDLAWLAAAAASHDTHRELHRVTAPTLVISGSEDEITPLRAQERLVERITGARHEIIDGAGHAVFADAPERTAELVAAFVRR